MNSDNFIKICGLSSIIAAVCYIGTVIFSITAGLTKPDDLAAMSGYLTDYYNARYLMTAYGWFGILGSLFTIPAILGYYQYLRKEGPKQWIPAAIIYHGVVLLTLAYIIPLVLSYYIAPTFNTAVDASAIQSLLVIGQTLRILEDFFIIIGTILTLLTGITIISVIDFKEAILPKWFNILGIITGIISIGMIGTLFHGTIGTVFTIITSIDLSLMLIWMVIIGIFMMLPPKKDKEATN
ncbi:MAG: hypothetical protein ACFFDW_08885 [Candidatus Thorarchaeota archaeon]